MSARAATSGDMPKPVLSRIIIGGASGSFEACAEVGVAGAAFRAGGGVGPPSGRCRDLRRLRDCVVEFHHDLHTHERLATARVVGAAEVEAPVIDYAGREFPLLGNRMHHEHASNVVGSRRARDVVNVEAGDCRGDGLGISVDDRVVNQRYDKIATFNLRRSSRSGRRRAVRRFDSASRHARILA